MCFRFVYLVFMLLFLCRFGVVVNVLFYRHFVLVYADKVIHRFALCSCAYTVKYH